MSELVGVPTDPAGCARMFADFARSTARRAPLYTRLSEGLAAEPDLAGLLLHAPTQQRQPVLFFACVHALLLGADRTAPVDDALAAHYPNLTPVPASGDPTPALRSFCEHHVDELVALLATRSTQTNEIGRCAILLPVLGLLAREVGPLAHLDVGTSAGLNLLFDHYRYTYEPGGSVGGPSTVDLVCGTRGRVPVPPAMPVVAERSGLDRVPVDVHDPDRRRWLEACVWPDQTDRFERLRAALAIAATADVEVRAGDAVADTAPMAAAMGAHPVITNTWVLNYLSSAQRRAYLEALDGLGAERDVSWVFAESGALVPELPVADPTRSATEVVLVRWRAGRRDVAHLGVAHPHGYWLHWGG